MALLKSRVNCLSSFSFIRNPFIVSNDGFGCKTTKKKESFKFISPKSERNDKRKREKN